MIKLCDNWKWMNILKANKSWPTYKRIEEKWVECQQIQSLVKTIKAFTSGTA